GRFPEAAEASGVRVNVGQRRHRLCRAAGRTEKGTSMNERAAVRDRLVKELPTETVDLVLDEIAKTHELVEKAPEPDRVIEHDGWTGNVWQRGGEWHIEATSGNQKLVMNVEGHWTEQEVDAYVAEQIGIATERVRGRN